MKLLGQVGGDWVSEFGWLSSAPSNPPTPRNATPSPYSQGPSDGGAKPSSLLLFPVHRPYHVIASPCPTDAAGFLIGGRVWPCYQVVALTWGWHHPNLYPGDSSCGPIAEEEEEKEEESHDWQPRWPLLGG